MPVLTGKGKVRIGPIDADPDDMMEFEVKDFHIEFDTTISRTKARPTERWCRYCGGGIEDQAIWRMSCDPCWQEHHPTSFHVAALYGQFSLTHSQTARHAFASVITTA